MLAIRRFIIFAMLILAYPAAAPEAALIAEDRGDDRLTVEQIIEGRVAHLQSRPGPHGYPITEVRLAPGGESFVILGGYVDGVLWRAEEEAELSLGEMVRVRLEQSPLGWRPAGGCIGVNRLGAEGVTRAPGADRIDEYDAPAQVSSITPSSGPAVADASVEVVVEGINFGDRQGIGQIFFQGFFEHVPAQVLEWSDTRIRCVVPRPGLRGYPQLFTGSVKVWTPGGGWSDGLEWSGGARYHIDFQYAGDFWDNNRLPMPVHLNLRGFPWPEEVVREQLRQGLSAWNELPFSFGKFAYRGDLDRAETRQRDGINLIGWTAPWPHPKTWLAVTWSAIDSITGKRLETDVEFNGERPWSVSSQPAAGSYDFLSTLIHELGHWFRLGHVSDAGHVMSIFQTPGQTRRTLAAGDRQGASWIYPTFGRVGFSADSVYFGGENPDTLILDVQVTDRRGRPLEGLPAEYVLALAEPASGSSSPRLSTSSSSVAGGWLLAESATDGEGRTRIVIVDGSGEGLVRLRVVGGNSLLRDSPEIYVSGRERPVTTAPLTLAPLYPNPSLGGPLHASVRLAVSVPRLVARIFDARGRVVRVLHDSPAPAGELNLTVDIQAAGATMAPGLYFLDVRAENTRVTRKFVLLGG
jgi:hypothetical protein